MSRLLSYKCTPSESKQTPRYKLRKLIVNKGRIGPYRGRSNIILKIDRSKNVSCLLDIALRLHYTSLVWHWQWTFLEPIFRAFSLIGSSGRRNVPVPLTAVNSGSAAQSQDGDFLSLYLLSSLSLTYSVMSDPEKVSATSSRQSFETLVEHGENDDIAVSTGGKGSCSCKGDRGPVDSESPRPKPLLGPVAGKQTMQSSVTSDASDKDCVIKSSFKAQLSRSFFQSRSWGSASVDGGSPSPSKSRLGTVPVEDPITHESVVNSRVLLLYTGGALGWKVDPADLEGK